MAQLKSNKTFIFNCVFIAMLILPNAIMFTGLSYIITNPKDFPSIKSSLKDFKEFYSDSFGLKTGLTNKYLSFKSDILNENPIPNRVIKGNNGWYFLGNYHNNILNDTFGNDKVSIEELESISSNINDINTYLNSKNIKFYLVVAPNKSHIYPEHLPFQLNKNPNKLEQLKEYLKKEIDFEIIDPSESLLQNKNQRQLYYKSNTHWNDFGAYIGYSYATDKINQSFPIPKTQLSNFSSKTYPLNEEDITKMINIHTNETSQFFTKQNSSVVADSLSFSFQHYLNPDVPYKLLMHRDSFAVGLIPFFNESFGETIYTRGYTLDKDLIEKEQPNVVIFEIVERNLVQALSLLEK
ncbi:hypothetical protein [Mangrovimonas sp. DI 80]|uniref:alginate O-acetyltransferase AlgX-related protein n=1 Tax=Mangrovimonas sp. DI 80 TaxID=1779330 RepID=UPI0009761DA4|nr:hypothetical protein [Mangrovimonas sp. DI 80]OMP32511.1 hypothetical protein BKM32_05555 [Mangrovimonas sp. DI 80]